MDFLLTFWDWSDLVWPRYTGSLKVWGCRLGEGGYSWVGQTDTSYSLRPWRLESFISQVALFSRFMRIVLILPRESYPMGGVGWLVLSKFMDWSKPINNEWNRKWQYIVCSSSAKLPRFKSEANSIKVNPTSGKLAPY